MILAAAVASWLALEGGALAAEPAAPMRLDAAVESVFVAGEQAVPGPALDRWLAARAGDVVRLPFTVWRDPLGAVESAAVGRVASRPGVGVRLRDEALGISLADRLAYACGDVDPCVVSLAGRFGALVGPPDPTAFAVLAFHGALPTDAPAIAEAARSPGCLAIRALAQTHCARGPSRCATCRELAAAPPVPRLLDLCPDDADRVARPVIAVTVDGVPAYRTYDVLRSFADSAEARAFADRHGIVDVDLAL